MKNLFLLLAVIAAFSSPALAANDSVSVVDYGVVCNGTGDQSAAIMAADAVATPAGKALIFPGGSCRVVAPLVPLQGAHWIGQGWGTVIVQGSATTTTFDISNPTVVIENLRVITDTGVTRTVTSKTFNITAIGATHIRYVDVAYSGIAFNIENPTLNTVTLDFVTSSGVVAGGIDLNIKGCFLCFILNSEFSGNPSARGAAHINIHDVGGQVELINVNMFQATQGILINPGSGEVVTLVKATQVWVDNNPFIGINISPTGTGLVQRVDFTQGWIGNYGVGGVLLNGNVDQVNISDNDMPGYGANTYFGISATGTTRSTIRNNRIFGVLTGSGHGIVLSGAQNCEVSGNQIGPGVTIGIGVFGATDYCNIHDNDLTGSTYKFNSSATGTHNKNRDNMGYN